MRADLHPCYILHQRAYRETSMLLDVFSQEYGRVGLIARGIKSKNKQNIQGLLQPYQKLLISWSGKGNLPVLNKAEAIPPIKAFSGSIVMTCFYINELIVRLLHKNEPYSELFEIYETTLNTLKVCDEEQPILRRFEKELLEALGYGLVLDHDVNINNPIEKDQTYYYSLQSGPSIQAPKHGEYVMLSGETLLSLENNQFESNDCLKEARLLMRTILNSFLGHEPLVSRKLYQSYLNV